MLSLVLILKRCLLGFLLELSLAIGRLLLKLTRMVFLFQASRVHLLLSMFIFKNFFYFYSFREDDF